MLKFPEQKSLREKSIPDASTPNARYTLRCVLLLVCIMLNMMLMKLSAQQLIQLKGLVTSANGDIMPYVNVSSSDAGSGIGAITDDDGCYVLELANSGKIVFSHIGYEPVVAEIPRNGVLNAVMTPLVTELGGAEISAKRTRYRNRQNPAVDLIRKVIANKDSNRIESCATYTYGKYEKIQLSLNHLNDSAKNNPLFRSFPFLVNYIDTSQQTGRMSLPVFLREGISEHYFRKSPKAEKEYLLTSQMANFHDLIEQETIGVFMDGMVGGSNIYNNKIMVLENEYMSPVAPMAPNFYQYHILDTVLVGGTSCINLSVYPRNAQDFGFRGNLYIDVNGTYAIKRVELTFTKNTNVNFVNDFSLIQEYTLIDSIWCLTLDEAVIDFSLTKKRSMMLGKRTNTYFDYRFNHDIADSIFSGANKVDKQPGYDSQTAAYWQEKRPVALSRSEQGVYHMVTDMKTDPWFKQVLKLGGIIYSGYIEAGKYDIGPIESIISFNDVEGARFRFGGKTNAKFNKHLFFEGYAAYGVKDEKFKYQLGSMYSFNERKLHPWEYPMNLLSVFYENNIETPGQFFQYGNADRLILSFHRGDAQQMVYHRTFTMKYDKEYLSGFSFQPSFLRREEEPTGNLVFANDNGIINNLTTVQLGLKLRFALNERFYQIQRNRSTLNHTNPIFTLNYIYGMESFWGSDHTFHRLEAEINKRTWFSSLGFTDMWLKAGKIWNTVPFPLLFIHQANQNYAYQDAAFNMMNYMEFVSDQYALVYLSHCFNGWIFNRIPLVKKLKWREFITFKAIWGNVSDHNLPENNPDLLHFSAKPDNGEPTMFSLNEGPYMEAGVGIDNIFKFIRLDLVKRINYLGHSGVSQWGVRFKLRFVF